MSSDRIHRRTAILGLFALGGCGFAPVYGNGGGLRGLISFETPDSVAGFRMQEQFERRLGLPDDARYRLAVSLTERQRPAAITAVGDTIRYNVLGRAGWILTDLTSDEITARGQVETFTSYVATGSTVATQAAAADATARLSIALADMIVARLMILSPELSS